MSVVARHRTAMSRTTLSRPLQQAHNDGLLDGEVHIFDYGCGRGHDVRILTSLGLQARGWDPAHAPDQSLEQSEVVNLGYVVNVIEDPKERAESLTAAWRLATSVLIVSARLVWDPDSNSGEPFGDGRMTSLGTFQKYFTPEELKQWIESVLRVPATTAAPGIYYVFRDEQSAQRLLAHQTRQNSRPRLGVAELLYQQARELLEPVEAFVRDNRRLPTPTDLENSSEVIDGFGSIRSAFSLIRRVTGPSRWADVDLGNRKRSEQRFEEHLDDLQPLIDFISNRGRLPRKGELDNELKIAQEFGSTRGAFSLIRRVTGAEQWSQFEGTARDNFLVYTALAAFSGRPKFSDLPEDLQYDARDLFGSYTAACTSADQLLHSIADLEAINQACTAATFGKLTSEALYVHADYVDELPVLLRLYQGAARQITGNVDDAILLKLNRLKPQVSFLVYPTFETDPHPSIEASIVAKLGAVRVKYRYFGESSSPPILHRKELFVPAHHPSREKFSKLTRQEERAGLLDRPDIGTRDSWKIALENAGYEIQGHRLRKCKDTPG